MQTTTEFVNKKQTNCSNNVKQIVSKGEHNRKMTLMQSKHTDTSNEISPDVKKVNRRYYRNHLISFKPSTNTKSKTKTKTISFTVNKLPCKQEMPQIYNEHDMPLSIASAIEQKKNLTLKQILWLLNLGAINTDVVNQIHDNLRKNVNTKYVYVSHRKRVFSVSLYRWSDLIKIEGFIDKMLECS